MVQYVWTLPQGIPHWHGRIKRDASLRQKAFVVERIRASTAVICWPCYFILGCPRLPKSVVKAVVHGQSMLGQVGTNPRQWLVQADVCFQTETVSAVGVKVLVLKQSEMAVAAQRQEQTTINKEWPAAMTDMSSAWGRPVINPSPDSKRTIIVWSTAL